MTNQINFPALSDAALKTLIFEALREAFKREGQIAIEATEMAEKVRDEFSYEEIREATRKAEAKLRRDKQDAEAKAEADKQAALWQEKKEIAQKLSEFFEGDTDITVTVWMSGNEKRVYLNTTSKGRKDWKGKEIACLFITGNSKKPPMTIDTSEANKEALKALLAEIGAAWTGLKLDIATAL